MFEIGRICVKIAGRDASKKCVIIDVLDNQWVLIDGQTRRKKCNIKHLEPLTKTIEIEKNASNSLVVAELKKIGVVCAEKKEKIKQVGEDAETKKEEPQKKAEPKAKESKKLQKAPKEKPGKKPEKKTAKKTDA